MHRLMSWLVWIFVFCCSLSSAALAGTSDHRFPLEVNGRTLSKPEFHTLLTNNNHRLASLTPELRSEGFQPSFIDLKLSQRTTKAELERIARQAVTLDQFLTVILSFDNFRARPADIITGLEAQRNGQYWQVARIIESFHEPPVPAVAPPTTSSEPRTSPRATPTATPLKTASTTAPPPPNQWPFQTDLGFVLSVLLVLLILIQQHALRRQTARNLYLVDRLDRFKEKLHNTRHARDQLADRIKYLRGDGDPEKLRRQAENQEAEIANLANELATAYKENQKHRERIDQLFQEITTLEHHLSVLKPLTSFAPLADRADDFAALPPPLQIALEALIRCLAERSINDILKHRLSPLSRFRVTVHDRRPQRENLLWVTIGNINQRLSFAE